MDSFLTTFNYFTSNNNRKNTHIITDKLLVKYKDKIPFTYQKNSKQDLEKYLNIILKNQKLGIDINSIEYLEYNETKQQEEEQNNEKYLLDKYREFIEKFDIHNYSISLKEHNITLKENKKLCEIIYLISNWI